MMSRLGVRHLTVGLALACLAAPQSHASESERRALASLARALDRAVRNVSRPSATSVFGPAQATRAFRVPAVGIVLVVPPRRLPRPQPKEHPLGIVDREPSLVSDPELDPALRAYQEQALAMHEAAAQAQREAEQVLVQMMRATSRGDRRLASMPAFPPPPWLEWVAQERPRDARSADDVVADVRRGLLDTLAAHAPGGLSEGESVVAVVEFFSDDIVHPEALPSRTLTLRIPAADLGRLQRGEISAEDLAKGAAVSED